MKGIKFIQFCFLLQFIFCCTEARAETIPGTLDGPATVCTATNSGVLNLKDYTGTILRWEYSLNGSSLWTTIANLSSSYSYINLSQTTYFRTVVQLTGSPEGFSNVVKITVTDSTKGGMATVLSPLECTGNTVKMTLSGYTGAILNWESSTDNAVTWNTIALSSDSISKIYPNITQNILFRASVKNGVCPAKVSDSVKVTVSPPSVGGTVASNANVCEGSNTNTIQLSGQTGAIIRWESSATGVAPWTTINNTSSSLTYTNLLTSIYYRAISKSGNCTEAASSSVFIDVNKSSIAGFISGTQTACSTLNTGTLQLNGNNGTILQWEFSNDSGATWNTTSENSNTYTFNNLSQNTLYRVEVVNGVCPAIYSNTFLVSLKPIPVVNYTFTQACQGKTMTFTNTSTGNNLYSWDFDDGNASSVFSPSHTYLNAGTFNVKLTATSANGCSDSIRKSVIIYPKPSVNFISLDTACGYKQLVFTNNTSIASGTVSDYLWSFGDNSPISDVVSPSHTYTLANVYAVKLVAKSDKGCKDSLSKSVEIFAKPIANFTTSNVCKKSAAVFTNTSYINGGGLFYDWNLGDTQTSKLVSPNHLYTAAGSYNVSLMIYSSHGCKDTVIKKITIHEQPDLTIATANVCLTKTTTFTQTITPFVSNYTLVWNFGNAASYTGNTPTYVYTVPGTYTVTATLTTDSGCVATQTLINTIHPAPVVSFNVNNVCSTDSVHVVNQSAVSSGTISNAWTSGNGKLSVQTNPTFLYPLAGAYTIKLVVKTDKGCVDSLSKPITIYDVPKTNFSFTSGCDGKPIVFMNLSTVNSGVITTNSWDFGDNSNSTLINPSKLYSKFGTYPVQLKTVSSNGCKSELTKTVSVYEGPVADFSFTNVCLNQAVPFKNLTSLSKGTYSSFWTFGDAMNSTLNSPDHLYQTDGAKNVTLLVVSNNGCRDSIAKTVLAYPIPVVVASNDTTISNGFSVQLTATGALTYYWYPGTGLNNPLLSNPVASPAETTQYIVEGTSANGCYSYDTVTVSIDDNFIVIPYNIITPNGNGKNDTWVIKNIERYPRNKVTILDEWGVVIYKHAGYDNTWEGKNSNGEILPDGTYYYILSFDDNSRIYKGFITLLRNK